MGGGDFRGEDAAHFQVDGEKVCFVDGLDDHGEELHIIKSGNIHTLIIINSSPIEEGNPRRNKLK